MAKVSHDSETPAHGQQVITACAFIHHEFNGVRKVFLAKRADTKKFLPGKYELPGGHIDFGEDIVDGLKREIKEELGMTVTVGEPFDAFTYENSIKGAHAVEVVYFAKFVEPLEQITISPEDHSKYEWFSEEEIRERHAEMIPVGQAIHKNGDVDAEYQAVLKGFALLRGEDLNFG
ncbi:MAG TPA: NUDIX hydrolase [Patescibacteria group bacterium]|nr:NUDIX hydrolase [Patescibacteria group bacterium]